MESIDWLLHGGRYLTATVTLLSALLASAHAVIWKRDLRSALLWIVVIWLVPLAGPMLYLLLGINRIERRAKALRREAGRALVAPRVSPRVPEPAGQCAVPDALRPLANLVSQLVPRALLPGNRVLQHRPGPPTGGLRGLQTHQRPPRHPGRDGWPSSADEVARRHRAALCAFPVKWGVSVQK